MYKDFVAYISIVYERKNENNLNVDEQKGDQIKHSV